MTTFRKLRAFCRVLGANKRWGALSDNYGALRTPVKGEDKMRFCPLTYAYYLKEGVPISCNQYVYAGTKVGFTEIEAREIGHAADITQDSLHGSSLKLRRILERACGVKD